MTYAATMKSPSAVNTMFGSINRGTVKKLLQQVEKDVRASSDADDLILQGRLVKIALGQDVPPRSETVRSVSGNRLFTLDR